MVRFPVVMAADGNAVLAAYLASYGFPNAQIANALGVGSRTVSQCISDFKKVSADKGVL
jgi:plasmid maintenance system antidote protein VapI